jgi:zinc protease
MGAETKVETTVPVIRGMRQILGRMIAAPVSPDELKDAKASIINSFVGRFTSPFQVASQRAMLDMRGFPADYLPTYTTRIGAVTAPDVQRVARKYLHPADLTTVVVGPATLSKSLESLGPVKTTMPDTGE